MKTRTEHDTFGSIEVPANRLWGAQTQRSLQNFDSSGERQPVELIRALAQIKRSSALVNLALGLQDEKKTVAIVAAADEVIAGKHPDEFPLVVWQTYLKLFGITSMLEQFIFYQSQVCTSDLF